MVLVHDRPLAVDLAQTDCQAKIELDILSTGFPTRASHRGGDKRNIAAGGDVHLFDVENRGIGRAQAKNRSQVFL